MTSFHGGTSNIMAFRKNEKNDHSRGDDNLSMDSGYHSRKHSQAESFFVIDGKMQMRAAKVPTDELSYSNRAVVSDKDPCASEKHLEIKTSPNHRYVLSITSHPLVVPGTIGFNRPQRSWAMLSLGQEVDVMPFKIDRNKHFLSSITLEAEFLNKKKTTTEAFNTDEMRLDFLAQNMQVSFTVGQPLVFQWENMPKYTLSLTVKSLEALDFSQGGKSKNAHFGITYKETIVTFDKVEGSPLNLVGKSKGKKSTQSIINPDWNFNQMGIGGLDNEFSSIFRRAFASRVFPAELAAQLGIKHCRGILLYGPPGTGKTLMARQIGKMLNAREPKIVNGPSILDKYVGESEKNIRELFRPAEEEEQKLGPNSGLHIIIFDEIDAICKARGSVAGGTQVHDTVVNQLLSKIDGVDQLNNILVIGMTNRKDMIDEALIRPGRLEVQMEIGLPDEHGRVQILNIHTTKIRTNKKMAPDVDINELAKETKNFSGAEIEGLVRAAMSTAMNRLIKAGDKVEVDPEAQEKLQVTMADFRSALEHDCKPAFGVSIEELERYCANGIIGWGDPVRHVIEDAELLVQQTRTSERTPLITVLLHGPPSSGKTALAAKIARDSQFPFLKICTPENMVGFHDTAKCLAIKKIFDDAYKSTLSCIILDDIERLLDYVAIGPRFSNTVLQALLVLLKKMPPKGKRLLVIGTTSRKDVLEQMEMLQSFMSHIHTPSLRRTDQIVNVVEELGAFTDKEMDGLKKELGERSCCIGVKKLIVLVEMAKQSVEGNREVKLVEMLEDEGGLALQYS